MSVIARWKERKGNPVTNTVANNNTAGIWLTYFKETITALSNHKTSILISLKK